MKVFAFILIIVGILLGLYVGLWLGFVGGIVDFVEAVQGDPVSSWAVAMACVKFFLLPTAGWLIFYLMIVLAAVLSEARF